METRLTVSPPGICSMNYKLMLRTLGRTLQLEALCLLLPMMVSLLYQEDPDRKSVV